MRDSIAGRMVLVVLVGAAALSLWNFAVRPYPAGNDCPSPVGALTASPVDVPPRPEPWLSEEGADRNGDGIISDREERLHSVSVAAARSNLLEESGFQALQDQERERLECRDALTEAGFWVRGALPLGIAVLVLGLLRFVVTGRLRAEDE